MEHGTFIAATELSLPNSCKPPEMKYIEKKINKLLIYIFGEISGCREEFNLNLLFYGAMCIVWFFGGRGNVRL